MLKPAITVRFLPSQPGDVRHGEKAAGESAVPNSGPHLLSPSSLKDVSIYEGAKHSRGEYLEIFISAKGGNLHAVEFRPTNTPVPKFS